MFWKIYFWFIFIVLVLDIALRVFYSYSFLNAHHQIYTYFVTLFLALICLLGLFGYVFKKKIFFSAFWKVLSLSYFLSFLQFTITVSSATRFGRRDKTKKILRIL